MSFAFFPELDLTYRDSKSYSPRKISTLFIPTIKWMIYHTFLYLSTRLKLVVFHIPYVESIFVLYFI